MLKRRELVAEMASGGGAGMVAVAAVNDPAPNEIIVAICITNDTMVRWSNGRENEYGIQLYRI